MTMTKWKPFWWVGQGNLIFAKRPLKDYSATTVDFWGKQSVNKFFWGKKTKILFIRKDSHQLSVLRLGSFIQHTGFATNTALKNKSLKYKFFPVFSFRIWTKDRLLCMIYSIYLDVNHWCRSPNRIFFFFLHMRKAIYSIFHPVFFFLMSYKRMSKLTLLWCIWPSTIKANTCRVYSACIHQSRFVFLFCPTSCMLYYL